MKINERAIANTQFIGVCISVLCMLVGGSIYLYQFGTKPALDQMPLSVTYSRILLVFGIWLLINMQLVRVFMACCMFIKNKEKILSIVSIFVLLVLVISFYFIPLAFT